MKSKVYSFISAKGGSGKTILTATISDFLAKLGKKVLIIDADGSTNGLSLFYLNDLIDKKREKNNELRGIFESNYNYSLETTIQLDTNVSFIPATFQFNNTDCYDANAFKNHLVETINTIRKNSDFDYILIDCQAGSDIHSEMVIDDKISDEIIIVSEYDPISAAGIERMKGLFGKQLTYERTWVLLNKVLPEFAELNEDFLEISRYLPPIIWDSEVVKRYARKEIALDFENGNEYTLSIIKLLRTLFDKNLKEDLTAWLNKKSEIVKKPIYEEYKKIKMELDSYTNKEKISIIWSSLWQMFILLTGLVFLISKLLIVPNDIPYYLIICLSVMVVIIIIIIITFLQWKRVKTENKYEKQILIKRLQELELMKHSSIEKILRNNKRTKN